MSVELLGIPRDFEWQGKRYKVCQRDLFVESQFSSWACTEAALELWRLKAGVPADFYTEQQKLYSDKLLSKQFKWGTPTIHAVYWSEEGQKHILWLKMKRGESKGGDFIDRATLDEIAKDRGKWEELLMILWEQDEPDFFAKLKEEMAKTNPPPSQPSTSSSNLNQSTSTM